MNRKAAVVVTTVFVLGFLLGGLVTHMAGDRVWPAAAEEKRAGKQKGHGQPDVVEQLTRELSLSSEQRQQFEAILEESRGKFQVVYDEMRPRFREIREAGRNRIRAILTPEQLPKYEAFVAKIDEERKKKNRY